MLTAIISGPDTATLAQAMSEVCGETVRILDRKPNWWASTFPSEVLTCYSQTRGEWSTLCKFGSASTVRGAYGHRHGTAHEATVYREVLRHLDLSSPQFYGAYTPPESDQTWLFIEFLGEGAGVDEAASPADAMRAAARWLGTFHEAGTAFVGADRAPMLPRYDRNYYAQWPRRTASLAIRWHGQYPWLPALCEHALERSAACTEVPQTVIHGEFTPSNVLRRGGEICPVDWESAAVGFGEIDLVALVENWPDAVVACCEAEYQNARRQASEGTDFQTRLDLAWLYWHFRWLGERADWLETAHVTRRFDHLRLVGERLRLL